jgi:DNA polymerase III sliding clamp (beta) subunit (PCNA family)
MNFSIETAEMQKIVKLLGVTAQVSTQDFRGMVLIEASKDEGILFVSNNNSTAISVLSSKAKVITPGTVSILFNKIKSFVTAFQPWNGDYGAKEFNFIFSDDNLEMFVSNVHENGERSEGNIRLDYYDPYIVEKPAPFGEADFILNSNIFKSAVNKVSYAMNPNESKRFIQGMNLKFDKDNICFVGTDGVMLSEYKVKNISDVESGSHILYHDFIAGLKRALGEETQIFFEIQDRVIKAKFDNACFYGKLNIGHTYPPYEEKLKEFKNSIKISKEILMNNLMPFNDILDDEDNSRLTFSLKGGKLTIYNDDASFTCNYDIDYKKDFIIDLNGKKVIQTIDAVKDDVILIKFTDEFSHIIFDSGNFENQAGLITHIKRR